MWLCENDVKVRVGNGNWPKMKPKAEAAYDADWSLQNIQQTNNC